MSVFGNFGNFIRDAGEFNTYQQAGIAPPQGNQFASSFVPPPGFMGGGIPNLGNLGGAYNPFIGGYRHAGYGPQSRWDVNPRNLGMMPQSPYNMLSQQLAGTPFSPPPPPPPMGGFPAPGGVPPGIGSGYGKAGGGIPQQASPFMNSGMRTGGLTPAPQGAGGRDGGAPMMQQDLETTSNPANYAPSLNDQMRQGQVTSPFPMQRGTWRGGAPQHLTNMLGNAQAGQPGSRMGMQMPYPPAMSLPRHAMAGPGMQTLGLNAMMPFPGRPVQPMGFGGGRFMGGGNPYMNRGFSPAMFGGFQNSRDSGRAGLLMNPETGRRYGA